MSQDIVTEKDGGKLPQIRSEALVAVGSNVAFSANGIAEGVRLALQAVGEELGVNRTQSALYRTPAFPEGSGPDFINAALSVETTATPRETLAILHRIEARFGRDRSLRWGPRTLDLDLIGYGDRVLPDRETFLNWEQLPLEEQMHAVPDGLILPHPRLAERAFVLVPLCDVAPDWVHPITGRTPRQMLAAMPQKAVAEVIRL